VVLRSKAPPFTSTRNRTWAAPCCTCRTRPTARSIRFFVTPGDAHRIPFTFVVVENLAQPGWCCASTTAPTSSSRRAFRRSCARHGTTAMRFKSDQFCGHHRRASRIRHPSHIHGARWQEGNVGGADTRCGSRCASGAPSYAQATMQITPSAGGTTVISNVFFIGGPSATAHPGIWAARWRYFTGDKIELVTQDLSVGELRLQRVRQVDRVRLMNPVVLVVLAVAIGAILFLYSSKASAEIDTGAGTNTPQQPSRPAASEPGRRRTGAAVPRRDR